MKKHITFKRVESKKDNKSSVDKNIDINNANNIKINKIQTPKNSNDSLDSQNAQTLVVNKVFEKKKKFPFFVKRGKRADSAFLLLIFILLSCGLLMVFSASYATALYRHGDSYRFVSKQLIFIVLGILIMFFISKIDYRVLNYKKIPYIIYGISIILLIVVLFMKPINDARRWIYLPFDQTFQPSEVMKFALIVLFSKLIQDWYKKMHTFKYGFLYFMCLLAPVIILLMLETHLSATVLTCGIVIVLMYVGGTRLKYFVFCFVPLAIAGITAIIATKGVDYIMERVNGWLNPMADIKDSTWQTTQSLIAIGSGGLMGKGFGNSVQKYMYLPEPQNDFIFAIFCEEMGFIGAVMLIVVFVLLITRGIKIATKAPDKFGFFLAFGIIIKIGLQVIANIAVVTGVFPNTGISLPFFSYGGTAILIQLAEIGVLLSISRHSLEKKT